MTDDLREKRAAALETVPFLRQVLHNNEIVRVVCEPEAHRDRFRYVAILYSGERCLIADNGRNLYSTAFLYQRIVRQGKTEIARYFTLGSRPSPTFASDLIGEFEVEGRP